MKVTYKGPSDSVDVPYETEDGVSMTYVLERSVPTEVPDDLGASLIHQAAFMSRDANRTDLNKFSKAELVEEAKARRVAIDDDDTKADIVTKLTKGSD